MVNNTLHPSACFLIGCLADVRQLSENRPSVQGIISLIKPHVGFIQLIAVIMPTLGVSMIPVFRVSWLGILKKLQRVVDIRCLLKESLSLSEWRLL